MTQRPALRRRRFVLPYVSKGRSCRIKARRPSGRAPCNRHPHCGSRRAITSTNRELSTYNTWKQVSGMVDVTQTLNVSLGVLLFHRFDAIA